MGKAEVFFGVFKTRSAWAGVLVLFGVLGAAAVGAVAVGSDAAEQFRVLYAQNRAACVADAEVLTELGGGEPLQEREVLAISRMVEEDRVGYARLVEALQSLQDVPPEESGRKVALSYVARHFVVPVGAGCILDGVRQLLLYCKTPAQLREVALNGNGLDRLSARQALLYVAAIRRGWSSLAHPEAQKALERLALAVVLVPPGGVRVPGVFNKAGDGLAFVSTGYVLGFERVTPRAYIGDCSSLVSAICGMGRASTMMFEYVAVPDKVGADAQVSFQPEHWQVVREIQQRFVYEPGGAELVPGDVVVWRKWMGGKGVGGHVGYILQGGAIQDCTFGHLVSRDDRESIGFEICEGRPKMDLQPGQSLVEYVFRARSVSGGRG